jgi:hypothetical protein
MLVIQSPNPQLKEGLVLVDTPGIGSINKEHTAITYAFIPNADAIVFVTDVLKPLTTEEIAFLKQRILPHCQKIIFVVTKIDWVAVEDLHKILESDRKKLAETLDCPAENVAIIPVSSNAKLDYLKYEATKDLELSNFAELEKQIWQLASEERGVILLLRAISELDQSTREMKTPIQVESKALQNRTKEKLDALESEINQKRTHRKQLLENNAEWLGDLSYGLKDIKATIQSQFRQEFAKIESNAENYIRDVNFQKQPTEIFNLLEKEMAALLVKLNKAISNEAAGLHSQIKKKTKLELEPKEAKTLTADEIRDISRGNLTAIETSSWWEKSTQAVITSTFEGGAGAVVGGAIGGTAGAIIGGILGFFGGGGVGAVPGAKIGADIGVGLGTALGGLFGTTRGAIKGVQKVAEKDRNTIINELSKVVKKFLAQSQQICQENLNQVFIDLEQNMRQGLTSEIKREKENDERASQALQESRKLSQAEAAKRSQELQIPLQQLTQLQDKIAQLAQAIAEQSFSTTSPSSQPPKPPTQKPLQQKVTVTTDTNADYGDWADE